MGIKLLTLSVLLCTGVNASIFCQNASFSRQKKTVNPVSCVVNAESTKRASESDEQVILGYCPDEISDDYEAIGLNREASIATAIRIPASKMSGLIGGNITKIRIYAFAGQLSRVYAWIRPSLSETAIVLQKVATIVDGWNEVELATPYEITGNEIFIGYNGTLSADGVLPFAGKSNSDAAYLSVDGGWNNYYGENWGSLCIQAVATANTPENDLSVDDFTTGKTYYKLGESLDFTVRLTNQGTKPVNGYSVSYRIEDREEVRQEFNTELASGATLTYSAEIPLSEFVEGTHSIKVWCELSEAGVEDEIALNDTITGNFSAYETSYPRKMLLEHFTTLGCINCPLGRSVLTYITNGRDDVVWVAHHVGFGEDELTIPESSSYLSFGVSGAPAAMIDRTRVEPGTSYPPFQIGYTNVTTGAGIVSAYMDYCASVPAFVTVDIKNEYDPATRKLGITVTGERNAIFNTFYPEANLSIFLTEDGIVTQQDQVGATGTYIHNHTLRAILTSTFGDAITWEGNTFTYTTTTTLDDNWVAAKMTAVAIVNKPFDVITADANNAEVLNVNSSIIEDPTYDSISMQRLTEMNLRLEGGKLVIDGDYDRFDIYTVNGTEVHNGALTDGFYIIRIVSGNTVSMIKTFLQQK